ncbi:hypothetical protein [Coraliomargarita akajimensis]|uniref:Uncharacterized protein n=1 Tax=Coraliomargarita akajimensis (strain DSM 45221 / IAM 15411 / JCM 23193 / KCTC 12865 / 04OKA010-24) TaxID=583355 RepID=D5EI51_CORAD|nr:hypothetical protein [Coraliomargarita akajimensis]ADE56091.1 hypothetical protein Caka_3078 [Coraliomargarita akajimensis DSM 45221]
MQEKENQSEEPIDVLQILRDNTAIDKENQQPIKPTAEKSRKRQDYIICMLIVNPLILVPFFLLEQNIVTGLFTLSALATFSIGFTWIMWQVVGDY